MIISKQTALARLKTLPPKIKDSIFSEEDAAFIQQIGEKHGLSKEKVSSLALILSHIFFGFVHYQDLGKQVKETLGLDPKRSEELVSIINEKLIKDYKDDLDKIYHPLTNDEKEAGADIPIAPRTLEDVLSPQKELSMVSGISSAAKPFVPPPSDLPQSSNQSLGTLPPKPISAPAPMTGTPTPFVIQKQNIARPVGPTFKLEKRVDTKSFVPKPPPPKAAKIEFGSMPRPKVERIMQDLKSERQPVQHNEPKLSSFIPDVPKKPPPPKPTVMIPSIPNPPPSNHPFSSLPKPLQSKFEPPLPSYPFAPKENPLPQAPPSKI